MSRPRAYMRWFPADYLVDTVHLEPLEDCLYRRLLDQMWVKGGPMRDEAAMQKAARFTDEQWSEAWPAVREFFTEKEDGWVQGRLMRELALANRRYKAAVKAGRKSAQVRRSNAPSTDVERTLENRSNGSATNQNQNQNHTQTTTTRRREDDYPEDLLSVLRHLNDKSAATWMPGPATRYLHERLADGASVQECKRAIDEAAEREIRMHPKVIFSESVYPDLVSDTKPKPKPIKAWETPMEKARRIRRQREQESSQ